MFLLISQRRWLNDGCMMAEKGRGGWRVEGGRWKEEGENCVKWWVKTAQCQTDAGL